MTQIREDMLRKIEGMIGDRVGEIGDLLCRQEASPEEIQAVWLLLVSKVIAPIFTSVYQEGSPQMADDWLARALDMTGKACEVLGIKRQQFAVMRREVAP